MESSTQEWPKPMVRAQTLSESGLTFIPQNYVKPPGDRPGPMIFCDGQTAAGSNIPVIDIGGIVSGSEEAEDGETMKAISEACREWGFFQAVNHGVSSELAGRMRELWREFFDLPATAKEAYANSPATFEGYGSRLGLQKDAVLDWGDYFFLQLFPESLRSHDKWPQVPPNLSETTEEYGRVMMKLCESLAKVLSETLGFDKSFLWNAFGEEAIGSCIRINYYPICPQPDLTFGLSSHSDPGGITVLMPDYRVKGLQVLHRDTWIIVNPEDDAFIVNVGDQIQVLSNGIYKSVEHRVSVNSSEERVSIAFFYNPRGDLPIGPAQALVNPVRPPQYKSMTFNSYRMYLRNEGPRGKSQLESMTAE